MSREWGDFQTPKPLAALVLNTVLASELGGDWTRILEPTCGSGTFIQAVREHPAISDDAEIQGIEAQEKHLIAARNQLSISALNTHITLIHANIFNLDLGKDLTWTQSGKLLVIGNPPWVTNAELGSLHSVNLPQKSNVKWLSGLDAITGQANFDIAEAIWLKLIRELAQEAPTIALLCKTSVARNILQFAAEANLPITNSFIRRIDAKKWFKAAVDACLFCVEIGKNKTSLDTPVFSDLSSAVPERIMGVRDGTLIADVRHYTNISQLDGECLLTWRQGIKHDAASVMELSFDGERWKNKFGEIVEVEPEFIFPLLKCTDLFRGNICDIKKGVIVTQMSLGEDTNLLEHHAPRLWSYLQSHEDIFQRRKSSIYNGKPLFSMFGVGSYSFAPYKVAISGLHKHPVFQFITPVQDRPVLLDDTCYFLPVNNLYKAALLTALLNSPHSLSFFQALMFKDAKRPITKKLLQRINLAALVKVADRDQVLEAAQKLLAGINEQATPEVWERALAALLTHNAY